MRPGRLGRHNFLLHNYAFSGRHKPANAKFSKNPGHYISFFSSILVTANTDGTVTFFVFFTFGQFFSKNITDTELVLTAGDL
jgi:hypothetical protein